MYGMPQYGFPGGFTYPSQGSQGGAQMAAPLDAATLQQMQVAQAQALQAQVQAQQAMQEQQQQQQQSQPLTYAQQQSTPQQSAHISSQSESPLVLALIPSLILPQTCPTSPIKALKCKAY
jgi:hypothetical protein